MDLTNGYDLAISKAIPGTFVPDMATSSAPRTEELSGDALSGVGAVQGASFKDTVKSMLSDVNDKMTQSDQLTRDFAVGKTNDVNKVVTSVEEASLSMQFALAIRNKLLDAYQEVSRMQV